MFLLLALLLGIVAGLALAQYAWDELYVGKWWFVGVASISLFLTWGLYLAERPALSAGFLFHAVVSGISYWKSLTAKPRFR